jgi:hypothetical protein
MPTHISPAQVTHPRNLGIQAPAGPPPQSVSVVGFQGSPGTVSPDPVEVVSVALTVRRFGDYTLPCSVGWRGVAPDTGNALPKEYFATGSYPGGTASFAAGQAVAPIAFSLRAGDPPPSACAFKLELYEPTGCLIDEMGGAVTIAVPGRVAQPGDSTVALAVPFEALTRVGTAPTPHTLAVTRTGDLSATANVSILVEGALTSQVPASIFEGGVYPTGLLSFAVDEAMRPFTFVVSAGELPAIEQHARIRLLNPIGCVLAAGADQVVVRLPAAETDPGPDPGGGGGGTPSGGIVAYSDPTTTTASGAQLAVVECDTAAEVVAEAANKRSHTHRIEYTTDIGGFTIPATSGGTNRFPLIISAKGATGANLASAPAITGDVTTQAKFVWYWKIRTKGTVLNSTTDIWWTRWRAEGGKVIHMGRTTHRYDRNVWAYVEMLAVGQFGGDRHSEMISTDMRAVETCAKNYRMAYVWGHQSSSFSVASGGSVQFWYGTPGQAGNTAGNTTEVELPLTHLDAVLSDCLFDFPGMREALYFKNGPQFVTRVTARASQRSFALRGQNNKGTKWVQCSLPDGGDIQGTHHEFENCDFGKSLDLHFGGNPPPGPAGADKEQVGASHCRFRACRMATLSLGSGRIPYYINPTNIFDDVFEDVVANFTDFDGAAVPWTAGQQPGGSGKYYQKTTLVRRTASSVALLPWPTGGTGGGTDPLPTDPYALVPANYVAHLPAEQTGVSVTWIEGGGVELKSGNDEAAHKNMRIWCRTPPPTGKRLYVARFTVLDSITVANEGAGVFALWIFQFLGTASGVPADVTTWATNLYRGGDDADVADEYYRYRGQGHRNSFANHAQAGGAVSQTTRSRTYNGNTSTPDTAIAGVPDSVANDFAMAKDVEYEIRALLDPGSSTVPGTLTLTKTRLSDNQTHTKTFTSDLLRTRGSGGRMGLAAHRGRRIRIKPTPGVPLVATVMTTTTPPVVPPPATFADPSGSLSLLGDD